MKKTAILMATLVVLSLLMTACGGGAAAASTSLNVQLSEFAFTPNQWTVPAGKEITINLDNTGADEHSFVIMKLGTNIGNDFGTDDEPNVYWRGDLQPGESKTFTFTAPSDPGTYQVVCGFSGHYQAGMVGTLTVVAQ